MKQKTLPGKMPKRNLPVEIIASLLLVFFVHSIISNYIQLQSLKNLLAFYTRNPSTVAWLIIIIESIIAALLFMPRTRVIGFITVLIAALYAGYIQFSHPHYPHDFGGIINSLTKKQQYALYGLLCLLSITGLVLSVLKRKPKPEGSQEQVVFT